jgi:hypothetical protein
VKHGDEHGECFLILFALEQEETTGLQRNEVISSCARAAGASKPPVSARTRNAVASFAVFIFCLSNRSENERPLVRDAPLEQEVASCGSARDFFCRVRLSAKAA